MRRPRAQPRAGGGWPHPGHPRPWAAPSRTASWEHRVPRSRACGHSPDPTQDADSTARPELPRPPGLAPTVAPGWRPFPFPLPGLAACQSPFRSQLRPHLHQESLPNRLPSLGTTGPLTPVLISVDARSRVLSYIIHKYLPTVSCVSGSEGTAHAVAAGICGVPQYARHPALTVPFWARAVIPRWDGRGG